jgi:hypothetical protein
MQRKPSARGRLMQRKPSARLIGRRSAREVQCMAAPAQSLCTAPAPPPPDALAPPQPTNAGRFGRRPSGTYSASLPPASASTSAHASPPAPASAASASASAGFSSASTAVLSCTAGGPASRAVLRCSEPRPAPWRDAATAARRGGRSGGNGGDFVGRTPKYLSSPASMSSAVGGPFFSLSLAAGFSCETRRAS